MAQKVADNIDKEGIARRGQAIYDQRIRAVVEAEHRGQFLALDVDSGDYEIAEKLLTATQRLRQRHPDQVFYGVRVGYRTAYSMGGQMQLTGS